MVRHTHVSIVQILLLNGRRWDPPPPKSALSPVFLLKWFPEWSKDALLVQPILSTSYWWHGVARTNLRRHIKAGNSTNNNIWCVCMQVGKQTPFVSSEFVLSEIQLHTFQDCPCWALNVMSWECMRLSWCSLGKHQTNNQKWSQYTAAEFFCALP